MFEKATRYEGEKLREIAFPLGGIGTGTVSLTGVGGLAEWQIRNHPDQDSINQHTFFALWARKKGAKAVCRVLEGPVPPPFNRHQRAVYGQRYPGGGLGNSGVFGLPRVESTTFYGAYPFAAIDYHDRALPVGVRLVAYNPMMPMNPDESGLPCALFRFHVRNRTRSTVSLTLAMSMRNMTGTRRAGGARNRFVSGRGFSGLYFDNPTADRDDRHCGTMAIVTPWRSLTRRTAWLRLDWFDPLQTMWDEFSATGVLSDNVYRKTPPGELDAGTLGLRATLRPGQEKVLPLWVTWSFPVYEFPFGKVDFAGRAEGTSRGKPRWRNYYARRFPTALRVANYLVGREERLYNLSCRFRESLERSSVDPAVIAAVSSQMSILRSPTCIRLEDGTFYGFEGSHETEGSCPGSCTHVWNAAQALSFLYPTLQQSMNEQNYRYNFSPSGSGAMAFRIELPPAPLAHIPRAAVDGQMGEIVKIYQTWKVTGDTAWLRRLWPSMKRSLEYVWKYWDYRKRGVIDGMAHNTYDVEFHGPNTYSGAYYLAALQACANIAEFLGEHQKAREYSMLAVRGARWTDEHLWNGDYYVQQVRYDAYKHAEVPQRRPGREVPQMKAGEPKYQYGEGCLSEQVAGEWHARVAGLEVCLDRSHVRTALRSVYRNNFRRELWELSNCQRAFALQDEAALVSCSWPRGGRPALAFIYCDEAWTGIEYEVASHLIYEGMVKEGMSIVRAVGRRYDGARRNPWNQFEAGSYYARALASWALYPAYCGLEYDGVAGMLGFRARGTKCSYFWSAQKAWGTFSYRRGRVGLKVEFGRLRLKELRVRGGKPGGTVKINGRLARAAAGGDTLRLAVSARLRAGDELVAVTA